MENKSIRIFRLLNRFNLGGPTYNVSILTRSIGSPFETLLVGGVNQVYETDSLHIPHSMGIEPIVIPELKRSLLPWQDYKAYKKIKQKIKEYNPHIFHSHASKAGALGRFAAKQLQVPVIVHTFHGHVFEAYFNKTLSSFFVHTERRLAKFSDAIIALSERQKKELVEKYRIAPEEKVHIIPNGFDLEPYLKNHEEEKRVLFRNTYGVRDEEFALGWVGRLVSVKNPMMFAHVIHELLKLQKKFKAFIVGDGVFMKEMVNYFEKHQIPYSFFPIPGAVVYFLSWQRDITSILPGLDIMVLTSNNEGTPVSLIEAQVSRLPIVSTNVGGIQDIVIPNKTALLSSRGDVEAMVKNILFLMENPAYLFEMKKHGRDFVVKHFSYELLVERMRNLYFDLLLKKGITITRGDV